MMDEKPATAKEEKKYGKYDKWEVESWVRSICEAEEVKCDPEKMKYVAPLLKDKIKSLEAVKKSISSIDDIRAAAKSKKDSDSDEGYDD